MEARTAYEDGEPIGKIARRLGIPENTVKSWRYQAKKAPHLSTWDRRNGEARRHGKALDRLPQLAKHVEGASDETRATAAMLARVPEKERFLLNHAIQELVCPDSGFLQNRERMIAQLEKQPIAEHLKDCPDEVKILAWQASRLSSGLLEKFHHAVGHLVNGSALSPGYGAYPRLPREHQAQTNAMIQRLRENATARIKAPSPDRRRIRRLNDR